MVRRRPTMRELKRVVRLVAELDQSVTETVHAVRAKCPEWAVTPCRVRKALKAIARAQATEDVVEQPCRWYPNDLVECPAKKHCVRRMWRGQISRVAGYEDDQEELPAGYCTVSWLGEKLHQSQPQQIKATGLRLLDRPFVVGDRVSSQEDPESLGLVVEVDCRCTYSNREAAYPEVSGNVARPCGGFRGEDLVAHVASSWVGRVVDALFRVEVEVSRPPRTELVDRGRVVGKCAFQVGTNGLQGLNGEAAWDQPSWQEMCTHFPGQKVSAPWRVWREAEWLERAPKGQRNLEGLVTSVSCEMLGVHWLDRHKERSEREPDEWLEPKAVQRLDLPNSPAEGWSLGEHVQASTDPEGPCATLTKTATTVKVKWADGSMEDLPSTQLLPRQGFYSHDFLPHDFVARTAEAAAEDYSQPGAEGPGAAMEPSGPQPIQAAQSDAKAVAGQEILPSHQVPLGVVQSVNLKARTAVVSWDNRLEAPQEVSLFDLAPHEVDVRLGDVVFLPTAPGRSLEVCVGRVMSLEDFNAHILLLSGECVVEHVETLQVADIEGMEEPAAEMVEDWGEDHGCIIPLELRTEEERDLPLPLALMQPPEEPEEPEPEEPLETQGGSSASMALDVFEDLPADHAFADRSAPAPRVLLRAFRREMATLRAGLLSAEGLVAPIVVRSYASRSELFRAMVVGPPGTPYADVPFFFDLALPSQYPAEPPLVHYMAYYVNSSERLNPNLYNNGKVCLSLLGTWSGPGWDPGHSTLLQVLISLQGLVLVEDPYFNEPGHEWDANTEHGKTASALYNENVRLLSLRTALNTLRRPPKGFEEVVAKHFAEHGPRLLAQSEAASGSEGFRQVLCKSILPALRQQWG